jgi:hypothetical protein
MEAIRSAAIEALGQTREITDQPFAGTSDPQPSGWDVRDVQDEVEPIDVHREPIAMDYSPSVAPPVRDEELDDEDDDVPAADEKKSRYSRHSAKLPRIGVQPGLNSDTIANLRKQMTSDS